MKYLKNVMLTAAFAIFGFAAPIQAQQEVCVREDGQETCLVIDNVDSIARATIDSLADRHQTDINQLLTFIQQDDNRITFLEGEVTSLQSEVTTLSTRLDSLIASLEDDAPPSDTTDTTTPSSDSVFIVSEDSVSAVVRVTWDSDSGKSYDADVRESDGSRATNGVSPVPAIRNLDAGPVDWTITKQSASRDLRFLIQQYTQQADGTRSFDSTRIDVPISIAAATGGGGGTQPPPSSPDTIGTAVAGPNEPAGFTKVVVGDCDANMAAQGWGWNNQRHPVDETSFPNTPTCKVHYPQGFSNPIGGHSNGTNYWNVQHFHSTEVYATARVKFSTSWVNGGGGLKIFGLMRPQADCSGESGGKQFLWVGGMEGHTTGTQGEMQMTMDQKFHHTCGQPNTPIVTRTGARFTLGQVHQIEVYARLNSDAATADGEWRLYFDGQLVGRDTSVQWYGDPSWDAREFMGIKWFPSLGGRTDGNDPAQDFWIDDFYVSTP